MQPNWDDLKTFLTVAQTGQLARAAQLQQLDATTIGRRLRRLEATLGETLFEQTRQGQVLTTAGERLREHVETMQGAADQITELGAGGGTGLSGTLRVSVSEGFGMWFIARHLGHFSGQFPHLGVDLIATSGFLNPSRREADLAVLLARPASGPVICSKLSDYSLGLFGSASYIERRGRPDGVADLHRHDLVGYIPDLLYAPELRYLDEIDQGLSPTLRSSSINAQYQLVASGVGIGVLPHFIGAADPALVAVLPMVRIVRSFWIVAHRDTHQLRRVRAFRSWLIELCRDRRHDLLRD